ncbi:hypothetical protein DFP91_0877 [Pseudorhodoplanes sinuspersici]|nr:hypothetical protein DFP91_0877 [Pseudorhodoplanes sinuspersici]
MWGFYSMFLRFIAVMSLAWAVSGCVTTNQHSLSGSDLQSFKLAEVRVVVPPEASIVGYDGINEYLAGRNVPNYELNAATETEEAKQWTRDHLAARIKGAMQQNLAGTFNGNRPVRAEVTVHGFMLSSAVQRIVVGGNYHMVADVTLVDAKTGAVIVAYPKMVHVVQALNGWAGAIVQAAYDAANSPGERVVKGFAEQYRGWLLKT